MKVGPFEVDDSVPKLQNARAIAMLRPWVDVGKVGTLALTKLEEHLGAKELGRLSRPGVFLDFTRDRPHTSLVDGRRVLTVPNCVVRYGRDAEAEKDYIFLHLREPNANGEDYTDAIVALLQHFDVTEYCRVGSMYDNVPHTRPLLVTGSLSETYTERVQDLVSVRKSTYQGPTSIVNLVNEALSDAGVETASLMVHIPQYLQLEDDHLGAARLMEVLCAMYGFPSSLADPGPGKQQHEYIDRAVEGNDEVKRHIQRLEAEYDRTEASEEPSDQASLSPDVERFLRDVGKRLDGS